MWDSNPFVNYIVTVAIFMVISLISLSLVGDGDIFSAFNDPDMIMSMWVAGSILWFIGFSALKFSGVNDSMNGMDMNMKM